MRNPFARAEEADLAIIDSLFPQKEPLSFRNAEINEYLRRINGARSYTMHPIKPDQEAWFSHGYGVSYHEFKENKQGYLSHYPENADKVKYLAQNKNYRFQLAYILFLAETYTMLPYFERHDIPFIFVLYPGGAFGLDNEQSDVMLRKIFRSKCFRAVIVTQAITYDYVINKNLCPASAVTYIYGGFVQFKKRDIAQKKYYKQDKASFDICFVAAKYSDRGVDKGYDLFIETAKKLCKTTTDIRFHVIGGFDEKDVDVSSIESRIKFYGYRRPDFLLNFYSQMDIFLAPNRPFKLYEGNFDGFPLGIDAGYCGVGLLVADELAMNRTYAPEKEIDIIPLDSNAIADRVLYYYNTLEDLYALSSRGQHRTQELFDIDYQVGERIRVFERYAKLEIKIR